LHNKFILFNSIKQNFYHKEINKIFNEKEFYL
jgi:hypothetical protein